MVVEPLFREPVRVFGPADIHGMLTSASLEIVAEHGVRVFSDYVGSDDMTDERYRQVFELELTLGARPEFAAIARYTQVIARRSSASSSKQRGQ
jgi:hypothetical protein